MNPQTPNSDSLLDRALREWRVTAELPPRFSERVWHRIGKQEQVESPSLWMAWASWLNGLFARPAVAAVYLCILLAGGIVAGYWHARHDNAQLSEELSSRYVRLMDPYQMPHH